MGKNGITEQAKNKAKQAVKKQARALLKIALPYIAGFLGIVFLIVIIYAIFVGITDNVKEFFADTNEKISEWWIHVWGGLTEEEKKSLDELIERIESVGPSLSELGIIREVDEENLVGEQKEFIQEEKRKIIRKFVEAQISSQEFKARNEKGNVEVYSNLVSRIDYVDYNVFRDMVENEPGNAKNFFSINGDNVALCKFSVIETHKEADVPYSTTTASIVEIPYKNLISQYSTPVSFFIALGSCARTPEFIDEVAEHVKDCKIELEVCYTENVTERTIETSWKENTAKYIKGVEDDDSQRNSWKNEVSEKIITTEYIPQLKIKSVDTWIVKKEIDNEYVTGEFGEEIVVEEEEIGDEEKKDPKWDKLSDEKKKKKKNEVEEVTWKTNQKKVIKEKYKTNAHREGHTSIYVDKLKEKNSFIKLLKKGYYSPYPTEKRIPGEMLEGSASMLFSLLQQNPETADLEQVMRYAMYLYNGNDYGVTELERDKMFGDFQSVGGIYGSSIEEKIWFALKNLGYSDVAVWGAMGNISWESGGFKPEIVEKGTGGKGGIGLIQWTGGRRTSLENYATHKGVEWKDLDTQIEFLIAEITGEGLAKEYADKRVMGSIGDEGIVGTSEQWKNSKTIEEATLYFMRFFESPESIESLQERIELAIEISKNINKEKLVGYFEEYKSGELVRKIYEL